MAQSYSLALYSIIINRRGDKRDRIVLTDFLNGNNLYDIAYQMLASIKYNSEKDQEKKIIANKTDIEEKRFFRIMKDEKGDCLFSKRPYLTGIIESGEYGTEENIVNVETGETNKKSLKDALLRPFYFMLYVPKGGKRAILLLERISNIGILTVFEKRLQETISAKIGEESWGLVVTIEPIAIENVLKKHLQNIGGAKKVILNQVAFKDITASKISDGELSNDEIANTQVIFSASRNKNINVLSWLNKIKERRESESGTNHIYSVSGVEYHDVKFEVEIGGSVRTISMQDISKLGTYIDITDKIELATNGYPTFASIDKQANELITDVKRQIENE